MSAWDDDFDFMGWFDIDGDGKTDAGELWTAQMMFQKANEEKTTDYDEDFDDFFGWGGSGDGDSGESHRSEEDDREYSWRSEAFEGMLYDIDPEDYDTEEEYQEALEEAQYGTYNRQKANSFETKKEYTEDRYAWRAYEFGGLEYGIDAEDYETEEEYREALEEAKYGWRLHALEGLKYGIFGEDYETAEEYGKALEEAKYGWRACELEGLEYGIDAQDYETADEYYQAVEEAKYAWRLNDDEGSEYGIDPRDYETEAEYHRAISAFEEELAMTALEENSQDPETEREPEVAPKEKDWRQKYRGKTERYGLYAEKYKSEKAFLSAVRARKRRQVKKQEKERQRREEERAARNKPHLDPANMDDKTVYTYCGVVFPYGRAIYHYRTEDPTLEIGDKVIVPVGPEDMEGMGEIVTVEKHRRATAPYPVEKTKLIKRRCTKEEDDGESYGKS